jgi:hypothetical protein
VARDRHITRLPIDLHLDCGAVELVERRRAAQRMLWLRFLAAFAHPDQLSTEPPEAAHDDIAYRQHAIANPHVTPLDRNIVLAHRLEAGGHRPDLGLDIAAGREDRVPHQHR